MLVGTPVIPAVTRRLHHDLRHARTPDRARSADAQGGSIRRRAAALLGLIGFVAAVGLPASSLAGKLRRRAYSETLLARGTGVHKREQCSFTFSGTYDPKTTASNLKLTVTTTL